MATHSTTKELRNMQVNDLQHEIDEKRLTVAKMKLENDARSQKNTSLLRKERRYLARLETIKHQKETETPALKTAPKSAKVLARRSSAEDSKADEGRAAPTKS